MARLCTQVEFADVILLNKCDLAGEEQALQDLEGLLVRLNPSAKILRTTRCEVDLSEVVGTGRWVRIWTAEQYRQTPAAVHQFDFWW